MKSRWNLCLSPALMGLALLPAFAQPAPRTDILQRAQLEIWVPRDHVMGRLDAPNADETVEYQWAPMLNEFRRDYPDAVLICKILERDEFVRTMHSLEHPPAPDLVFVDNGRELDHIMESGTALSTVSPSRFSQYGWWITFRDKRSFEAGKAFIRWLARSPSWKPWQVSSIMSPADVAVVQAVSKKVVAAVERGDMAALSSVMDRDASHVDFSSDPARAVERVEPLLTFGNSRLAFVLMSAVGEQEKTYEMTHFALVLRKVEKGWSVLLFQPGWLPALEETLRPLDRLGLTNGKPEALPKIKLIAPVDHAEIGRWPPGELQWAQLDPAPATYIVEYQFGQPNSAEWSPSWTALVSPRPGQSQVTMRIPFGVGAQPHRWRVWAIGKSGVVSTSEWRTIDFTN